MFVGCFKNFIIVLLMFSITSFAIANNLVQCQLVVNKDPTWLQETLKVDILDFNSKKIIQSMTLAAQTLKKPSVDTLTQTYDCNQYPKVMLQASYTPIIWSTGKGKIYPSKSIYDLTEQIQTATQKGVKILEITVKFPDDFIGVPLLVN